MKFNELREVELDIIFPYYCKHGLSMYKLISETLAIEVTEKYDIGIKIVKYTNVIGLVFKGGEITTPEAFTTAFANTLSYLNNLNQ